MSLPLAQSAWTGRRICSAYFLFTAVPFGLIALYGNFIFFSGFLEELANWSRRPHSWSAFETAGPVILYLALVNAGFFLLPGYHRSLLSQGDAPGKSGNQFWLLSLAYNLVLCVVHGAYACTQQLGTSILNPSALPFWVVFFPFIGALLSALCLTWRTSVPTPPLTP